MGPMQFAVTRRAGQVFVQIYRFAHWALKFLRGHNGGNINLVESDRSRVLLVLRKGFSPHVCTRYEGVARWQVLGVRRV